MASAGAGPFTRKGEGSSGPATGVEYGVPPDALEAPGGEVKVQVPTAVADRFEAAKARHDTSAGGVASNIDTATHKSGLETDVDRAKDMSEVARAKMQSGGEAETRTPDVGFPARKTTH